MIKNVDNLIMRLHEQEGYMPLFRVSEAYGVYMVELAKEMSAPAWWNR